MSLANRVLVSDYQSPSDRMRLAMLAVVLLLFLLVQAAPVRAAESSPTCWPRLSGLASLNLTGDPIYSEPVLDSLLAQLFSLRTHGVSVKANSGIGIGRVHLRQNPLTVEPSSGGCADSVAITVDLEQSYYGVLVDPGETVIGYAALGLLGALLADGASGAALVQLRATLRFGATEDSVTITSVGLVQIDLKKTPRRRAMTTAMRRSLHQLGYQVSEKLDNQFRLRMKTKSISMTPEKYLAIIDEGLTFDEKP